jgi:hypothetical protein
VQQDPLAANFSCAKEGAATGASLAGQSTPVSIGSAVGVSPVSQVGSCYRVEVMKSLATARSSGSADSIIAKLDRFEREYYWGANCWGISTTAI